VTRVKDSRNDRLRRFGRLNGVWTACQNIFSEGVILKLSSMSGKSSGLLLTRMNWRKFVCAGFLCGLFRDGPDGKSAYNGSKEAIPPTLEGQKGNPGSTVQKSAGAA
jgi:hypothetical protein